MYGLRVSAAERTAPPTAEFTCRCGEKQLARGARDVAALAAYAQEHRASCTGAPTRPCEHCGQPTATLSHGVNGYAAHPACREAWERRPVEVRRRDKQAKRIAESEKQRYRARRMREQMERDGYASDVIHAIVTGGTLIDPEADPGEQDDD